MFAFTMKAFLGFLTVCLLSSSSTWAQIAFKDEILNQVSDAAKFYFAKNANLDGTGFNVISFDEDWSPTELFKQQYGEDASSARFVAALLDFEYYEMKNFTFSDVTQFILVGEFPDARNAMAAYCFLLISEYINEDDQIYEDKIEDARALMNAAFRSAYDLVGDDRFASFLNLKLGSSLSFVMDTTGSMGGEIEAAKSRVVEIIENTKGTASAPLSYVLVPYNDPSYGPVTKTSDPDVFIAAVNSLFASGGGDLPELAMIGIQKAVENSGFRSIVYVFTDASAKDIELQNHVIALCLVKKVSVYVFVTENIARRKRALLTGRSLYDNVADLTGGAVMLVEKSDIEGATAIMEATTVQGLVMLDSISNTNASSITLTVDPTISSLLIQFTGTFDYDGYTTTGIDSATQVPLTAIEGVQLFRLDDISPGDYTFNFNAATTSDYGVLIRGKSTLGFHGILFQKRRGTDTFVPSRQLQAGQATRAEMTVYGDAKNVQFQTFQLISRNGDILVEKELDQISDILYRPTEEFELPAMPTFVRLTGTYRDGQFIERIDPCAVTPTVSESTLADIDDVTILSGNTLQIMTKLTNNGVGELFILHVSDDKEFVRINGATSELLGLSVTVPQGSETTITLTVNVPAGTEQGVLSKVVLTATGYGGDDNYFLFTTFVVSVVDDVIRCPSLISPSGGNLFCDPDGRSVGSVCQLHCGDEYVQEGIDVVICQGDGTWDEDVGSCSFRESQTCIVAGDPHYTTFDGWRFDFMGACLYTLVDTVENDTEIQPISIQTENDLFYGQTHVSWFKQAFVTIGSNTITMRKGKIILVNGILATPPIFLDNGTTQILFDGPDVLLKTDFRMEVRLNAGHYFRVSLPYSYTNKVTGLCGNYDGSSGNDNLIGNVSYSSVAEFGNALEIIGGSNPWCRKGQPGDDDLGCANEAQRAIMAEKCAGLKSDCFLDCADEEQLKKIVDDCVYDMCALGGEDEILENHYFDFASTCTDKGVQICNWREEFGFPTPTCGKNMHYEFRGNRCPNTCVAPNAAARCVSKPRSEGCVCNDGYVLENLECIHFSECGCAVGGRYYANGESVIQQGCNKKCSCVGGGWTCVNFACDADRECRITDSGVVGCELKQIDHCYATGDPHYKTLDGSRYDFMGICRYVMLSTEAFSLPDSDRHIVVSAQNEHRYGQTSVSYVKSVHIEFMDFEIQLGPGVKMQVMKNGSMLSEDMNYATDEFTINFRSFATEFKTNFGLTVSFTGMNLDLAVPSYFMNKVSGLCGNYTGSTDDDFGNITIINDFAAAHIYGDGCEEGDLEDFVCSDEDETRWRGLEFCGKLKDPAGPFQYCLGQVDVEVAFENCVFDACATDGEGIRQALQAYAKECTDRDGKLQCDWESRIGVEPDCPENSRYDGCASVCVDTCRNPTATLGCRSTEKVKACVCNFGYVWHEGECVKKTSCGCVIGTEYVEQGFTAMADNCAFKSTCVSSGNVDVENDPCGDTAKCKLVDSAYLCVPDEYPYALIYGAVHFKTFDNKFFDFHGNCAYLLAGYNSEGEGMMPSFKVIVKNDGACNKKVKVFSVVVEVEKNSGETMIATINRDKAVLVNGARYAAGSVLGMLSINRMGDRVILELMDKVRVLFNGMGWIRVDVNEEFAGKMYGMAGNNNADDDDDMPMNMTAAEWGDRWRSEEYSAEECFDNTEVIDISCPLKKRYQRSCDCGMISDSDGPFSKCHEKMDPEPFMKACVKDACIYDGSPSVIGKAMKAYYFACLGKGIRIENWRQMIGIEMECPMHSHYSNCTTQCQPTCRNPSRTCASSVCEEGCVCDDGYILSDGECVPDDKCGCVTENGAYYQHGSCRSNEDCSEKCSCVYGEWNCEETPCNEQQVCGMLDGEWGCHWKDKCKYDNGGCSDFCVNNTCTCGSGRILTKDGYTCVDISPTFFNKDDYSTCDSTFNIWKSEYLSWRNIYLPQWQKELDAYKEYVETGLVSVDMGVCKYAWTDWYDRDDPEGCGDEETVDMLRVDYPEICEKPIAAEARLSDGRRIGAMPANVEVNENGIFCKNADQDHGVNCPDFSVRFLCRVPMKKEGSTCG